MTKDSSVRSGGVRVSRIRWLRRLLLKIAMYRDPEALLPPELREGEEVFASARAGCLEDQIRLERAFYAYRYLRGDAALRKGKPNVQG